MADKIEIYGQRVSPFVERVYLQVHVKGIAGKVLFPGIPGGDLKSDEYLAINPFGKMPAMRAGDFTAYESSVIMEFLEETFPEVPLLPEDTKARAKVRQIIRILDLYYHTQTVRLIDQVLLRKRDTKKVNYVMETVRKVQGVVEGLIEGEDFAVGDKLTLADVTLYSSMYLGKYFAPHFKQDYFEGLDKLRTLYDNLGKREYFRDSNAIREKELLAFMKNMIEKELL